MDGCMDGWMDGRKPCDEYKYVMYVMSCSTINATQCNVQDVKQRKIRK